VTGDGTNDATQLANSDIGFAMNSGTEVAKEACDIILLDDNFASIVKAVMWGRNVFDAIRKFVQFQLTVNTVAVVTAFVGALSFGESPLKAIQLLWVNLIMDTMAALALATEAPTKELLHRPPHGRTTRLISLRMWRFIIGHASYQLVVMFVLLYRADKWAFLEIESLEVHNTIVFNTFVLCQVWNELNARRLENELNILHNITTNYIFIGVIVFTVLVQAIIVQVGGAATQTSPLSLKQWAFCLAIGFAELIWGFLLKAIPIPADKPAIPSWKPAENMDDEHIYLINDEDRPNPPPIWKTPFSRPGVRFSKRFRSSHWIKDNKRVIKSQKQFNAEFLVNTV